MLDIKQLKQLVALYETGTVTAAASKLCLSQPALTAQLSRMESRLGEKLFVRSAKGLEPTPLAQSLYSRSLRMLQQWRVFDTEVGLLTGTELGEIRIVCGAVIEQGILPAATVQFLKKYPHVELNVTVQNPERMIDSLRAGNTDVAVGAFDDVTGIDAQLLDTRNQRIAFFVRAGHPLLGMKRWKSHLKKFPLAAPQIPAAMQHWLTNYALLPAHRSIASDSYTLLKQLALDSDHLVGAPQFLLADEVAAGKLVQLPLKDTPLWRVSVLISRAASQSKVARAFTACVKE